MSTELVAVLGAIAALFTAIGAYVKVTYAKPKAIADAEAQRIANSFAPVAHLERLLVNTQEQIGHLNAEVLLLRKDNRDTWAQLDSAMDRIGILAQENRAWARYHAAVTQYQRDLSGRMRAAGMDVPEPPQPPHPRTEFTRRSDFPTREEFEGEHREDHHQRRGDESTT